MPSREAFLQEIVENPDDDAPRLIYADWLEEAGESPRAEFIRVQCELARLPEDDEVWRPILQEREWTLLSAHANEWLAELPVLEGIRCDESMPLGKRDMLPRFERGFANAIAAENEKAFLEHAAAIFRMTPVTSLRFNRHVDDLELLLSHPELRHLRQLGMSAQVDRNRIDLLANCPRLSQLSDLDLSINKMGDEEIQILTDSPILTRLTYLDLRANDISARGAQALKKWPVHKQLESLALAGNRIGNTGARKLLSWPKLTDLMLNGNGIGPEWVSALVESPLITRLRGLSLYGNTIGNGGARLLTDCSRPIRLNQLDIGDSGIDFTALAPHLAQAAWLHGLRVLDLSDNQILTSGASALAKLATSGHLPKLKVLNLSDSGISDEGVLALVDSPLSSQLEELNLSGNPFSKKVASLLRKRMRDRIVKYW